MRKKALDFLCGLVVVLAFLSSMGAIGAFEVGNITGPDCVVRFAAGMSIAVVVCGLNAMLMDAVERRRGH